MSVKIVVPDLGESVVEATVAAWLKQEGDPVKAGEAIVSLETDKVDLDVPAPRDGVLSKIERQAGEDVRVGEVLAQLDAADGAPSEPAKAEPVKPEAAIPEATKPEAAKAEPPKAETSPAEATVAAPPTPAEPEAAAERATPVAKRMAQEKGVDLGEVAGAGPGGRVTKRDVEAYLSRQEPAPAAAPPMPQPAAPAAPQETAPAVPAPSALLSAADGRGEERVRLSRRRRTIADRLVEAQRTAAILTTFNEADMSAVMEMRKRKRDDFTKQHGVSLGFMSFFVKAGVGALRAFPMLNASLDGNEVVLKHYYDIGIAVGAEEGLVVPVLRDADRMSFAQIEQSINDLATKAREGTLALEDLRGGTFTISNGGVYGSLLSTPILNPPQVGILGLHKIEQRPVVVNGEIVIRPMMYLALSYDHRLIDGSDAVRFLVKIKQLIEDPEELLLAG
ncbi:MAG: 2-oxoglutarate dehydrogenase complex dihydrolipoyllysine-residue succinyltransferase [Caldilineaceae bacterium]|nr:2-oxoglutarate dehydrogenase complex dihydrolipoyllysine-residue succinyltransferase [Caldilineaceae bacterium]